jgi:enoyl-CoA hydratase/3-hydroxyacyl-CoA dehydrogenase
MKQGRQNPLLEAPERPLPKRVAVVGAGTIGPDISYYLKSSIPNLELILVDVVRDALDRAVRRIERYVKKGLARSKLTEEQAAGVMDHLVPTLDYEDIAGSDWVVEAATEDLDLKRRIFARVEGIVTRDTLITSNTSSLPARWLFQALEHPERATVTHFFAPAFRNPVVEVADWERVAPEVVEHLRWLFCTTGKVPLVTADAVCFMLDRVFDNWCNEAAYLLEQATASEVDAVAHDYVKAGPFFVLNLAHGNPIIVKTNTLQMEEEGDHYRPAPIFRSVETWNTLAPGERIDVEPETAARIRDRLLGVLFSQAVDIVDRGIGVPEDLELGCRLALGFRQGPFRLMEELGEAGTRRILERFTAERPGMPTPRRSLSSYRGFVRHLLVDDVDGVRILTLRRPQVLNALDDDVTDELLAVIGRHEHAPEVRGFVIIGYGSRAFCAGADLGRFPDLLGEREAAAQYARDCSRLLAHLDGMEKPVVAALNGMALGGGLELALRCHGIVALEGARLQFPEVTLGIAPGLGAMVVPYRRWPEAASTFHEMIRGGSTLDAGQAEELGVVDRLADDTPSLIRLAVARVEELIGRVTPIPDGPVEIPPFPSLEAALYEERGLSPEVIELIERAIRDAAVASTFQQALEIGYEAFGATACTEAAREKITAFVTSEKG